MTDVQPITNFDLATIEGRSLLKAQFEQIGSFIYRAKEATENLHSYSMTPEMMSERRTLITILGMAHQQMLEVAWRLDRMGTSNKIPIDAIEIIPVETPGEPITYHTDLDGDAWSKANKWLTNTALSLQPQYGTEDNLGCFKTDIVFHFGNGDEIRLQYDQLKPATVTYNLAEWLWIELAFTAGIYHPSHMSQRDWENYIEQIVSIEGQIQPRNCLNVCDIPQPAALPGRIVEPPHDSKRHCNS